MTQHLDINQMTDNITEVIDRLDTLRDRLSRTGQEIPKADKDLLRLVYAQTEMHRLVQSIKVGFITGDTDYMGNAFYDLESITKELS